VADRRVGDGHVGHKSSLRGRLSSVPVQKRLLGVDLFDDPSWDSEDGMAFDRMGVLGFSSRTESVIALVAICMFILSVALSVLFFLNLHDFFQQLNHMFQHAFDGPRL
jgi:hypothetical protein